MKTIEEILSKLNKDQIKPVLDTEGAVLVIAGAGSGKTRVLTSRIAYLVLEKGVKPYEIAAITFTNKAAGEMKERLEGLIGDVSDMWVSTIHSMCVRILRSNADKLGYDKNFSIYDETDKDRALKAVTRELGFEDDGLVKSAKYYISAAKNDCLTPDDFKKEYCEIKFADEIFAIYSAYEKNLKSSNSFDFDDLLFKTYELFSRFPEVADYYSDKFKYVHIDEFQDTNKVQFAIAQRLSVRHGNLFVVGDDDQSIYGWRGAKIENILSFDDIYRGAKIYKLEQNYRSTKKILKLANDIIANNTSRRDKTLWTDNDDGARVETFIGTDENNEATYAALQIKNVMARGGESYKDFAVFMRVNALSRAFEQEFTKYGIPYKVYGGFRFFERKEIKDALSYLKLINNPKDNEAFLRCVAFPKRGIGDKTLNDLREFCDSYGFSLYEGVGVIANSPISGAAKQKLTAFRSLIERLKEYSEKHAVTDTMRYMLEETEFYEQFAEKTEENTSRLYNLSELLNSAEQFEKDNGDVSLSDYLNSVTLSTDTDTINDGDAVTIATIHASKGLEYDCVFVAGLDERIFPVSRAYDNETDMEEERRLMYVAVTRARKRLYLLRATSRYLYGKREYTVESRFFKEAKRSLGYSVEAKTPSADKYREGYGYKNDYSDGENYSFSNGGGYSSGYAKTMLKGNKPMERVNSDFSRYKSGVKVRHQKFGEGIVINVKGSGDNIIVDVAFKGVGIKSLSAKYAPMELI